MLGYRSKDLKGDTGGDDSESGLASQINYLLKFRLETCWLKKQFMCANHLDRLTYGSYKCWWDTVIFVIAK